MTSENMRQAGRSPVATEYAAFNSVSPSASHILMLVSHQPPEAFNLVLAHCSPCGNTGCTHGVGL